jgi:GAF domain-containing protein
MSTPNLRDTKYDTQDTARLAFMLKLVDTLQSMPDVHAIEEVACRLLAEFLPVERTYFAEINLDLQMINFPSECVRDRSASLSGAWLLGSLSSMVSALESGQPFILDDAAGSASLDKKENTFYETNQIRSFMAFTVLKGIRTLSCIAVANAGPHNWTAREISLVQEVAIRTGDAITRARPGDRQRKTREDMSFRYEQQTKDLLVLRDERAILMKNLDAQVARLDRLIRGLLNANGIGDKHQVP